MITDISLLFQTICKVKPFFQGRNLWSNIEQKQSYKKEQEHESNHLILEASPHQSRFDARY